MPHISLNTCALIGHLAPPGVLPWRAQEPDTLGWWLALDVAPHRRIALPCIASRPEVGALALQQAAGQRLLLRGALETDEQGRLVVVCESITPILS